MEWILSNWLPLFLFGGAAALALWKRGGSWSAVGSMALGGAAVLAALVWDWTLERILTGVLVLCVVSFLPLMGKGDGDEF